MLVLSNHALIILTAPALDTLTKIVNPDEADEVEMWCEFIWYQLQ